MAGKDLLTEEKSEINAEAEEAFGAEDMVSSLEHDLADDADDSLGGAPDEEESEIAEGIQPDDDEPAAGAEAETDDDADGAAGVDRGDGRDAKGKFASKAEQDAADKATADARKAGKTAEEQQAAGKAAAAAAKPAAVAAPKWEPLTIRADKAIHPIDEAKVQKVQDAQGNEHFVIAVAAKDYPRFQQRLGRGAVADRRWREMQEKERELEFARTAPKPRSDTEIEADLFMQALKAKQGSEEGLALLDEIFEPQELENLKLRVQIAQRDEKINFDKKESERRSEASASEDWGRFQTDTLVNEAFDLVEKYTDESGKRPLEGMTADEVKAVLEELALPVRDKIVYKENGETFVNNEYLFKLLLRGRGAPRTPAPTSQAAAPVVPDKKGANAERFNNGQESAAQPRSTSLRQNRGTRPASPGAPSRDSARRPQDDRTPQQVAEDEARTTRRNMMRSDSLDFDDE